MLIFLGVKYGSRKPERYCFLVCYENLQRAPPLPPRVGKINFLDYSVKHIYVYKYICTLIHTEDENVPVIQLQYTL